MADLIADHFAQLNDQGITLVVQFVDQDGNVIDISQASAIKLEMGAPDLTVAEKNATFLNTGTDGKIYYVTADGDLAQVGFYKIQGKATLGGLPVRTRTGILQVFDNVN